jgi:putative addiction module killer protein
MIEVRQTAIFRDWLAALRDLRAVARIDTRIGRLRQGNFGDAKSVGDGVGELRIDYGPGYRVYFTRRGEKIVLLLCGGDKGDQTRDIARAKALAAVEKG